MAKYSPMLLSDGNLEVLPERQIALPIHTLPIHQYDIAVHDTCATCVPHPLPADLRIIVDAWASLPDAMKAGMVAMVRAARPS